MQVEEARVERERMVERQLVARGIRDPAVLEAMRRVPRDRFVPPEYRAEAHGDHPLPIGYGQTISQPYVVALMTEAADVARVEGRARVLEVGSGSGYQAAVLAALGAEVHGIELVPELADAAARTLRSLGYARAHVRPGDGYAGEPSRAPFDAILVTAAAPVVPEPLLRQLRLGGRLVIPVGDEEQELLVITRREDGFDRRAILPVRFVPMLGEVRRAAERQRGRDPSS